MRIPPLPSTAVGRFAARSLLCWLGLSVLVAVGVGMAIATGGRGALDQLIQEGPLSIRAQTMLSVAVVWMGLGVALAAALVFGGPPARVLQIVCCFLVLTMHTNVLRERIRYGDVGDYVQAAYKLAEGEPLPPRYLYPPLLATVQQPLLPLGKEGVMAALWLANLGALVAFQLLLSACLRRYGFGEFSAVIATFLFLVVSVPLLRTLAYVQVNLHLINLVMLALLLFDRYPVWSAVALAAAVHLKASPIVLALPFLLAGKGTWAVAFGGAMAGFVALTVVPFGWSPFRDFLANATRIHLDNPIVFRDNSIDSLLRSIAWALEVELPRILAPLVKGGLMLAIVAVIVRSVRARDFAAVGGRGSLLVHNALPGALLVMVFASPIVWEHHLVMTALPYLVVLRRLRNVAEAVVFLFAFTFQFLLPTFDFFPWSFARLVSLLMLLYLFWTTSGHEAAPWIDQAEQWFRRGMPARAA